MEKEKEKGTLNSIATADRVKVTNEQTA